jgi:predicted metal-dependent enzyme (double-stranded beta helix superfamily)
VLSERDVLPLGRDIIHSVTNPIGRLTGAIHVYGGDFFGVPAASGSRSGWWNSQAMYRARRALQVQDLYDQSNLRCHEKHGSAGVLTC